MNDTLKTILNGLKMSFGSELKRVKKAASEATDTANTAASSVDGKMNAKDPVGSGSFSMNRLKDSVVGNNSHAEGYGSTASGLSSHAEGQVTTASGNYSHAEGFSSTASGDKSHAEGSSCIASGDGAHAEGSKSTASGSESHAEGRETEAKGVSSHAEGIVSAASGDYSHAEGQTTTASGKASHAEGSKCTASGDYSHAEGENTIAASAHQHVQGKDNIEDSEGKYLHIVGNGKLLNEKKNAHTIDWDGLGWFAGGLKVGGRGQDDEAAEEVALKKDVPTVTSKLTNDAGFIRKSDLEAVKPTAANVNPLVGDFLNGCTLLGSYSRSDASVTTAEEYEITLSDSIENFAMLYAAVVSDIYVLGSALIPVSMFKTQLPNASGDSIFELNFVNDQQNLFGGNVRYVSNTSVKGKVVGKTRTFVLYGIGPVNTAT